MNDQWGKGEAPLILHGTTLPQDEKLACSTRMQQSCSLEAHACFKHVGLKVEHETYTRESSAHKYHDVHVHGTTEWQKQYKLNNSYIIPTSDSFFFILRSITIDDLAL